MHMLPSILKCRMKMKQNEWIFTISSRFFNTIAHTCALELASPHAFSRGSALGAVRGLTAGLSAVAGEEDLSLVDSTVMFRRTAN